MSFNILSKFNSGLWDFFRRYGIGTVDEIIEIIGGFLTTTPGVYNPVNYPDRWKNVKSKPYETKDFDFNINLPLTVICDKDRNKKFRLPVIKNFDFIKKQPINSLYKIISENVSSFDIIKSCLVKIKTNKLHIIQEIDGINVNPLTIKTSVDDYNHTPITVKTWLKLQKQNRIGVKLLSEGRLLLRLSEGSYIINDVGNISDIELLDIIKEVEIINGIRQ